VLVTRSRFVCVAESVSAFAQMGQSVRGVTVELSRAHYKKNEDPELQVESKRQKESDPTCHALAPEGSGTHNPRDFVGLSNALHLGHQVRGSSSSLSFVDGFLTRLMEEEQPFDLDTLAGDILHSSPPASPSKPTSKTGKKPSKKKHNGKGNGKGANPSKAVDVDDVEMSDSDITQ